MTCTSLVRVCGVYQRRYSSYALGSYGPSSYTQSSWAFSHCATHGSIFTGHCVLVPPLLLCLRNVPLQLEAVVTELAKTYTNMCRV